MPSTTCLLPPMHLAPIDMNSRMSIKSLLNPESKNNLLPSLSSYALPNLPRSRSRSRSPSREYSSSPETTGPDHHSSPRLARDERCSPAWSSLEGRSASARSFRRERREFRPSYQQEEEYFIWYHRVDLGLDWADVRLAYNEQFPQRQRRGFQGIQCKYYRCCENHGVPRVRDRNRTASPEQSYNIRSWLPELWYPWMRSAEDDAKTLRACKELVHRRPMKRTPDLNSTPKKRGR